MAYFVSQLTGERFSADDAVWCDPQGGLLDLITEQPFLHERIVTDDFSMWRYRHAIPIDDDEAIISFGEGMTPLIEVEFAGTAILVKLEYLFPTGSYKDRGASVLISQARRLGINRVIEDSSGNAGSAIAAYCARAGMDCDIYAPASTSPSKITQIEKFGATCHQVPGSRDATAEVAKQSANNCFYASHVWNPYFLQGTKTFAFEVCEQLGWTAPDCIIIPTGNGTLLLGAYIGFGELVDAGVIQCIPPLIAVQSAGCAPLYNAWLRDATGPVLDETQSTMAEGIAIADPARGSEILAAVRATDGEFVAVSENEIRTAHQQCAAQGLFVEPTSATAIAGWQKLEHNYGMPVIPLTGSGLKSGLR